MNIRRLSKWGDKDYRCYKNPYLRSLNVDLENIMKYESDYLEFKIPFSRVTKM